MKSNSLRTVLFDLDGTLADTAPDLAAALNAVLAESGRDPLPYEAIRPVVSHGATALIRLGFRLPPEDPTFARLRRRLLDVYEANVAAHTRLFPGMEDLLDALEARGYSWGIVTNKPAFLTQPLVTALGLQERAVCVVSGDTTPNKKPHPEPLYYACRCAGSEPRECVYVGDAERDIRAGREAGMKTLVALFGYLAAEDRPQTWGADDMVDHPLAILDWLSAA